MSGFDRWNITISDGREGVEFETLAHVEDADYSWSGEAILKRKSDGALFFARDSGCSCNSFGEYLTVADLKPIFSVDEGLRLSSDRPNLQKSYEIREGVYR